MIEQAKAGVSYGIELNLGLSREVWVMRYGWFDEEPGDSDYPDDEPGLAKAKRNLEYLIESERYEPEDVRIVKRTVSVEVVE